MDNEGGTKPLEELLAKNNPPIELRRSLPGRHVGEIETA